MIPLEGQNLTLLLLAIIAPVGALDAMYFHVWKFKLASRPESRNETATHIFRSLTLGIVALTVAFYQPAGAWFWLIAGLLGLDFANNLIDAFLEGDSRRDLGGVPQAEYLIHIAGATWVGAAALSFLVHGWTAAFLPTALMAPEAAVPFALQANAVVIGIGSFALAALETALIAKSLGGAKAQVAATP